MCAKILFMSMSQYSSYNNYHYIIIPLLSFFAAWSLICRCTSRCNDGVCNSADLCYTRATFENNELEYDYGCVDYNDDFAHLRQQCLEGSSDDFDLRKIECCNNESLCNEHLRPLPDAYVYRTTTQDPTTTTPTVGPTSGTGMGLDPEQVWDWDMIKAFHIFQCNKGTSLFMPYSL